MILNEFIMQGVDMSHCYVEHQLYQLYSVAVFTQKYQTDQSELSIPECVQ